MKPSQKRRCELFAYNLGLAEKGVGSAKPVLISLTSEAYSSSLCVFDIEKVTYYKEKLYQKKLKPTSTSDLISARMSLQSESNLNKMYSIYSDLKKRLKNHCSECHIQYAAYILSEYAGSLDSARSAHLATKQLESIRSNKKALRCGNDLVIASLLASYNAQHREKNSDDIAECIKELKARNISPSVAKYVARVLVFGKGVASARCDRFIRLIELLQDRDVKLGNGKEASIVAFASLIDVDDDILADSCAEVNNYFRLSNDFSTEASRSMYSVIIACGQLASEIEDSTTCLIKEATVSNILSFEF